jgi:hypothetical protein
MGIEYKNFKTALNTIKKHHDLADKVGDALSRYGSEQVYFSGSLILERALIDLIEAHFSRGPAVSDWIYEHDFGRRNNQPLRKLWQELSAQNTTQKKRGPKPPCN